MFLVAMWKQTRIGFFTSVSVELPLEMGPAYELSKGSIG